MKFASYPMVPKAEKSRCSPLQYRSRADVFKALGNPSRLLIVDELSQGERCVADLTELIGTDMSTVSNHLSVLRHIGLVVDEHRGQHVFYRLGAPSVIKLFQWLDELSVERAARL